MRGRPGDRRGDRRWSLLGSCWSPASTSARPRSARPTRIGVILHRALRARSRADAGPPATETIVWDLRLPRVLTAAARRGRAGRGRGHIPGHRAQPAGRPVRARDVVGRGARRGHRDPAAGRHRRRPVRPGQRAGVRRRARCRVRSCSASAAWRVGRADPAAADRLRRRVDPRRAADDGDVRVRREPASDLLVPARWPRRRVVGAARWSRRRSSSPRAWSSVRAHARSTGCSSATRRPRHLGIDVRNANAASCWRWRRWPRPRRSRSAG